MFELTLTLILEVFPHLLIGWKDLGCGIPRFRTLTLPLLDDSEYLWPCKLRLPHFMDSSPFW
jgi:hypothetical protein